MKESDWLSSADPRAMLTALRPTRSGDASPIQAEGGLAGISDRKLRLWVEACRELADPNIIPTWVLSDPQDLHRALEGWSDIRCKYADRLPVAVRADLLRDICGNPFRRVSYRWGDHWERPFGGEKCLYELKSRVMVPQKGGGPYPSEEWVEVPWIHHNGGTVVALAREIYGEEACGYCTVRGRQADLGFWLGHKGPCPECHGTGKIARPFDAALMPVLGDVLEDTGCRDVEILNHCRGLRRCSLCLGDGLFHDPLTQQLFSKHHPCQECHGDGWVRSETPCVRGCWVVDCILGLE